MAQPFTAGTIKLLMACNFSIPFSGSSKDVLSTAKHAVQNQGGSFRGDENSGMFQISVMGSPIRGSYTVEGQDLNITIDTKPFLIPCSTIENFLRAQLR
jgi:hypothetical protein